MSNPLFVGIDIALDNNRVCLLDQQGQPVGKRFSVTNSRRGSQVLVQRLAETLSQGAYDSLRIAAEATNWYWFPLFQSLAQAPSLKPWPVTLYALNPRLVATYKQTYSDRDKTDDIDAFAVADRLKLGRDLPAPFMAEPPLLALRMLTRYRYHLIRTLVREKNYYLSVLYLKASAYRPGHPFADVFGLTSQALLGEFATMDEIAAQSVEELAELIQTKSKGQIHDSQDKARELQGVAQDCYALAPALQPAVNHVLNWNAEHIRFLQRQLNHIDRAIAEEMTQHPQTLDTIPGIGAVYAAGLIAEIGDLARFDYDEARVANFAGLKWSKRQSGQFEAEDTPLTRAGNHYLRYYFCEAANAVRMHDAEYAAYYDCKFKEVPKHQHKRAIVLTARKLVRLVVRLLTTNERYRPRRSSSA
jgi:transposase